MTLHPSSAEPTPAGASVPPPVSGVAATTGAAVAAGPDSPSEVMSRHVAAVKRKTGRNLYAATASSIVILGALAACLLFFQWGFVIIVALGLSLGLVELHRSLRDHAGTRITVVPLVVGTCVMVLGAHAADTVWVLDHSLPWSPTGIIAGVTVLTAIACLAVRLVDPLAGYIRDVGASLLALIYVPVLGSTMVLLLDASQGVDRVTLFILCVAAGDTAALFVGLAFGRHKLAPTISPNKTWEGAIGALLGSAAVGVPLGILWLSASWLDALIIAWSISVAGILGDLIESAIKRELGIKDLGNLLPGHGGVMDRIDAYLIAAPIAWILMSIVLPYA